MATFWNTEEYIRIPSHAQRARSHLKPLVKLNETAKIKGPFQERTCITTHPTSNPNTHQPSNHAKPPRTPADFTHGTTSVMRMCRAGQQMFVLDRRDRSQARCSPSVCHRRLRRAPSVGCAPCATALARPLLFTVSDPAAPPLIRKPRDETQLPNQATTCQIW